MGFTAAQLEYVTEVLGVKQVLTPENFKPEKAVLSEPSTGLCVVTAPLISTEKELLNKMLASVKLSNFEVLEVNSLDKLSLSASAIYLVFGFSPDCFSGFTSYSFESLPTLNDSSDLNKQKQLKLKAWNTLKGVRI